MSSFFEGIEDEIMDVDITETMKKFYTNDYSDYPKFHNVPIVPLCDIVSGELIIDFKNPLIWSRQGDGIEMTDENVYVLRKIYEQADYVFPCMNYKKYLKFRKPVWENRFQEFSRKTLYTIYEYGTEKGMGRNMEHELRKSLHPKIHDVIIDISNNSWKQIKPEYVEEFI